MEADWALWPSATYRTLILDAVYRSGLWAELVTGASLQELSDRGFSESWLQRLWPLLQRWDWIATDDGQRWRWVATENVVTAVAMVGQMREWLSLPTRLRPALSSEDVSLLHKVQEQTQAMRTAPPVVSLFLEVVGDVRGQRWLDVGSGPGLLGTALAARGAIVTLFDRPEVASMWDHQNTARVRYIAGDAMSALPPGPYDGVALVRFVEYFSPAGVRSLFERCAGSLKDGGRLVILGYLDPRCDAWDLFCVEVGLNAPRGSTYTTQTLQRLALGTNLRPSMPPTHDATHGYTALVFQKDGLCNPPNHGAGQAHTPCQDHGGKELVQVGAAQDDD
ncbi:MAG: class I SAM-dependent methyltransferase [Firmicutes bacterium]|nr:class I SAM-dependent methyltransferase [Bacillota bacterium]